MDNKCLCSIRHIYKVINAFEHNMQQQFQLNLNEAMLLCTLSSADDMSAGEIARSMDLSASNASKVIASLEQRSLIRRRVCKQDSRCMRFHITQSGSELLSKIHCDSFQLPQELNRFITAEY